MQVGPAHGAHHAGTGGDGHFPVLLTALLGEEMFDTAHLNLVADGRQAPVLGLVVQSQVALRSRKGAVQVGLTRQQATERPEHLQLLVASHAQAEVGTGELPRRFAEQTNQLLDTDQPITVGQRRAVQPNRRQQVIQVAAQCRHLGRKSGQCGAAYLVTNAHGHSVKRLPDEDAVFVVS